jgi:SAM-dependent methyltransferase
MSSMSLHVNYLYLLNKATLDARECWPVVLDYGCGSGQIIEEGRKAGLEIYGAEAFYEGGNTRAEIEKQGWLGTVVREIENGIIAFKNNFFDLVISNQVLEHVEDLDAVLYEIHRVLKPGGAFLCMFPTKEGIREGHCGIPFIHWFPKQSRLRYFYALALRRMGFGYYKKNKSASQWTCDFLHWLDRFTHYRNIKTIAGNFREYFEVSFMEDDYIVFRLNRQRRTLLSRIFQLPFVRPIGCTLFRRLCGVVILARKGEDPGLPSLDNRLRPDWEHVRTQATEDAHSANSLNCQDKAFSWARQPNTGLERLHSCAG